MKCARHERARLLSTLEVSGRSNQQPPAQTCVYFCGEEPALAPNSWCSFTAAFLDRARWRAAVCSPAGRAEMILDCVVYIPSFELSFWVPNVVELKDFPVLSSRAGEQSLTLDWS